MTDHHYFNILLIILCISTDVLGIKKAYKNCDWKTCIGFRDKEKDCLKNKNCKVLLTLEEYRGYFNVTILHTVYLEKSKEKGDSYVAIGYSTDNKMGHDIVTACSINRACRVGSSINIVNGQNRENRAINDTGIEFLHYVSDNSTLKCSWLRHMTSELEALEGGSPLPKDLLPIDLSNEYHILMAYSEGRTSDKGKDNNLWKHTPTDRYASKTAIDLSERECEQKFILEDRLCIFLEIQKYVTNEVTVGEFKECADQPDKCNFALMIWLKEDKLAFTVNLYFGSTHHKLSRTRLYISVGLVSSYLDKDSKISLMDVVFYASTVHTHDVSFTESYAENRTMDISEISSALLNVLDVQKSLEHLKATWTKPLKWTHNGVEFDTTKNYFYIYFKFGSMHSKGDLSKDPSEKYYITPFPVVFPNVKDAHIDVFCKDAHKCYGMRDDTSANSSCINKRNCLVVLRIDRYVGKYTLTLRSSIVSPLVVALGLLKSHNATKGVLFTCSNLEGKPDSDILWKDGSGSGNAQNIRGISVHQTTFQTDGAIGLSCNYTIAAKFSVADQRYVDQKYDLTEIKTHMQLLYEIETGQKPKTESFEVAVVLTETLDILEPDPDEAHEQRSTDEEEALPSRNYVIFIILGVVTLLVLIGFIIAVAYTLVVGKKKLKEALLKEQQSPPKKPLPTPKSKPVTATSSKETTMAVVLFRRTSGVSMYSKGGNVASKMDAKNSKSDSSFQASSKVAQSPPSAATSAVSLKSALDSSARSGTSSNTDGSEVSKVSSKSRVEHSAGLTGQRSKET